jgi:hypothetical protein
MMRHGVLVGMISSFRYGDFPKFIWCVGEDGDVYEAKTDPITPGIYHGYRLEEEDVMHELVRRAWKQRCPVAGQ